MKRTSFWLLFWILLASCRVDSIPRKHEMRGVWVATVKNIDWPSQPTHSAKILKDEFRKIAAFHQLNGFNAMVVQVRPATDAMYPSDIEPWSEWLTGTQGLGPEPKFDPMHFMIEETHDRGMEFHAWFNPYRAVVDVDTAQTALNHISRTQPGWFLKYGDNLYFDPGIPEAREYLVSVIGEAVRKYDLDAVHFDDYFYPYKIAGIEFPDSLSFHQYGRDYPSLDDWRRDNVNRLVQQLHDEIKSVKPYVKFGISPFGVWRNIDKDPLGSATRAGQTNYDDLYADVLLWMKNGWIDYVVPQIYWHIGFELADYKVLSAWWSEQQFNGHLYIGESSYRIGSNRSEEWQKPGEMLDHLRLNQEHPEILGNVFFNTKSFFSNPLGFTDSLRSKRYAYPAIIPPMEWVDNEPPATPETLVVNADKNGNYLNWVYDGDESPAYFLIYRQRGWKEMDLADPRNIIAKVRYPATFFLDRESRKGKYTYIVSAVDRNNNESSGSAALRIKR